MEKMVLITGGSGGIGLELAKLFARDGHNLLLVAQNADRLQSAQTDLQNEFNVRVETMSVNLAQNGAVEKLYNDVAQQQMQVDILVNNAGFGDNMAFLESNWDKQKSMIDLNITALMQLTYLFGNDMKGRGYGRILNLSSIAGFFPGPYMATYYASKAFVLSFSQALSVELKDTGVTVTALCPGPTATSFEKTAEMKRAKLFANATPAAAVARTGYKALMKGKPVASHGALVKLASFASRLVTRKTTARIAGKMSKPDTAKKP